MAYHKRLMERAKEKYIARVRAFNDREDARKERLLRSSPRLAEIDRRLSALSFRMARAALAGRKADIADIRCEAETLYETQAAILTEIGKDKNLLRPHYLCSVCEDAGIRSDGTPCKCLLSFYTREMLEKYANFLGEASFSAFSFELYPEIVNSLYETSPRISADFVYDQCLDFARGFQPGRSMGIYLHGGCGVGKTFIAASVAREVIEKGYYVHCISAIRMFAVQDRARFGHATEEEKEDLEACFDADLLVLDDLGAEYGSPQNAPFLSRLLNERMALRKSVMVVSGLRPEELTSRYSSQVESRIAGSLSDLLLVGEDLRKADNN